MRFSPHCSPVDVSRRNAQICRNVLRAALAAAVDEGLLPRSPATRVGLPTADRRRENFDRQAADVVVAFVAGA